MRPVRLPALLVLTDRLGCGGRDVLDVVRAAAEGGATAVVVREKGLPRAQRARLVGRLREVVPIVVVASDPSIHGDGVHLAGADPRPRPHGRHEGLVGRSCHSPADLDRAATEACDYATLSPVFCSRSKPGYGPVLGTAALGDAPLPVYALGGIDADNAGACIAAGAAGVAVMGAVMAAADPAAAVAALLRAIAPVAA
ncbi:MAG: thiamine phosphate synthase [Acidimicrobiia bacterium]